MEVNNKKLYHIHTFAHAPVFNIGQKIIWGFEPNHYWNFYKTSNIRYQKDPYQGKFAAKLAQMHLNSPNINNLNLSVDVLRFLANATMEMGMFNRELIFEEYRREFFPTSPSRRTCIWLCEKESLDFWLKWFQDNPKNIIVYEVSCNGKIHKGNSKYLNSDSMNYTEYYNNASHYWNINKTDNDMKNEIIFEGETEIICKV